MNLKLALFSPSSLKHIRWRFRTCVSSRVSVKRYVQNKILRRCASMYNKWYYTLSSSFEILHHLLPSIFVLTFFCQGCRTGPQAVVSLILRIFVCFSSVFRMFFTVATVTACWSPAELKARDLCCCCIVLRMKYDYEFLVLKMISTVTRVKSYYVAMQQVWLLPRCDGTL